MESPAAIGAAWPLTRQIVTQPPPEEVRQPWEILPDGCRAASIVDIPKICWYTDFFPISVFLNG